MRELSPFELDRELARAVPPARAACRALRAGMPAELRLPEVLEDPETLERVVSDKTDPIAQPLVRWLYWLRLARRSFAAERERAKLYRAEPHALDAPMSGHFSWRELLGHALRDAKRRPALLEVLCERGEPLRDAGTRLFEVRAQLVSFGDRERDELELPCAEISQLAHGFLTDSADAFSSLSAHSPSDLLRLGLAHDAADGWPRRLDLRSLHELLGEPAWLSGLRLDPGAWPVPIAPASFVRGFLRLGAAWTEAISSPSQPFSITHDPFRLSGSMQGALFAQLPRSPAFLKRRLGLGKERALRHARALSQSALVFARSLALRVLLDRPALAGSSALRDAFSEHAARAFGFELPPAAAGLLFRPRLGDAQRLAGLWLAATRNRELSELYDEDWFRNPRAIEQSRAEASAPAPTSCTPEALRAGARILIERLSNAL
jgi:hypothetical protein